MALENLLLLIQAQIGKFNSVSNGGVELYVTVI